MIDLTTSRSVNYHMRIPALVKGLLFGLAIISSLVIGYAMGAGKHRGMVPAVIFAVVVSAVIFTILDLDNPRYGLIRLDAAAQALQDVRTSMN
jgi:lipopolysaccharide export LptBFGC system permease protein LptF